MAIWHKGSLGGFDSSPVEVAGRIIGKRAGEWFFDDGIKMRWIQREYIQSYRYLKDGFCVLTLPAWLVSKTKYQPKRSSFAKWSVPR